MRIDENTGLAALPPGQFWRAGPDRNGAPYLSLMTTVETTVFRIWRTKTYTKAVKIGGRRYFPKIHGGDARKAMRYASIKTLEMIIDPQLDEAAAAPHYGDYPPNTIVIQAGEET